MKQKKRIKVGMVLVIVFVMSFSDWSFAVGADFGSLPWFLNCIISILSWLWVILAKVAGEFLTNKWVYGEVLGIDILLWQYRNIVKNMANFCLGFYLVYVIFKGLIGQYGGKQDIMKNLGSKLLRVLVAGVGIQASWFLTSVVVDMSTIVLSAVGSLPAQVISENETLENTIKNSRAVIFGDNGKIYNLFPEDGAANSFSKIVNVSIDNNLTEQQFLDEILPKKDSVAGPLYYMGWSILRTFEINSIDSTNLKKSLINLIVQGGTTIVYSIEIAVLCVLALMRILYLWMFIVLSPLAILLACLQKSQEKDVLNIGFVSDLMKQINLKTFVLKVFQPSVIVLGISICLIFVTLINRVVNNDSTKSMDNFDIGGAKITNLCKKIDTTSDDESCDTRLDGNLLKLSISNIGKGFLDFMMAIITVVLVYLIIKITVKMGGGKDFVSQSINKVQDSVGGAMTSIPIVPVPGHDGQGVSTIGAVSLKGLASLPEQKLNSMVQEENTVTSEQVDSLMKKLGLNNDNLLTQSQKSAISAAGSGSKGLAVLEAKRDYIKNENNKVISEKGKGMILNPNALDQYWIGEFTAWLDNVNANDLLDSPYPWKTMKDTWQKMRDNKSLEELFQDKTNGSKFVEAYAKFFGLDNVNTWNELKEADISKKKSK